jgi:uncharacterized membrane-anchored protein
MTIDPTLKSLIVGTATTFLFQAAKRASAWLDRQNPSTKQLLVVLVATVLTIVGQYVGVSTPTDLHLLTPSTIAQILGAALSAMGAHSVISSTTTSVTTDEQK